MNAGDEDGVAGYIAAWQPSPAPPRAAAFARQVVSQAAPAGRDRAKNLLWAAGKLAGWAIPLGLEPAPQVLLHPSVTGRFTAHSPGLSGPARRTLRTSLRFIARAAVPHLDRRTRRCPASAPRRRTRLPRSPGSSRSPMRSPPSAGGCAGPRWYAWAPAPG
jgi:hypothetical protein